MQEYFAGLRLTRIACLLSVVLLTSCTYAFSFTPSRNIDGDVKQKSILLFGYIDTQEADIDLEWAMVRQYRPATKKPFKLMRTDGKGLVYLENLPTGSFRLESFGGREWSGINRVHRTWELPNQNPEFEYMEVRALAPGIYFVGAYKVHLVKKGFWFIPDKTRLLPITELTEKKLLKQLSQITKGTKWHAIVRKKISRLKKEGAI